MESNGWSRVRDNSDNLVVRVHLASGKFEICLTDLASLWSISQSSQDILKACQTFNPLIESTAEKLMSHLQSVIQTGCGYDLVKDDSNFMLHISSKLDHLPFKWSFQLKLQDSHKVFPLKSFLSRLVSSSEFIQFRQYVSFPMLFMMMESITIQEELCSIIRNKDKEIQDYQSASAQLTRRHLETRPFIKEDFLARRHIGRSVDKNSVDDIFEHFCQATHQSYSHILDKVLAREIDEKSTESDYIEPSNSVDTDTTSCLKTPKKITEAERSEALKRRLRQAELKERTKLTKKDKPKLIL